VICAYARDADIAALLRVSWAWYAAAKPHTVRKLRLDADMRIVGSGQALIDTEIDGRTVFRTSWLRHTHTLDVAKHDSDACACLTSISTFPNLSTLRCSVWVHHDLPLRWNIFHGLAPPCNLYNLSPATLIHRVEFNDGRSFPRIPPTLRVDTHILELPTSFPPQLVNGGLGFSWFASHPWATARVVVVAPTLAHREVGHTLLSAMSAAVSAGVSFTVVGGCPTTWIADTPGGPNLHPTLVDLRDWVQMYAEAFAPSEATKEVHVVETMSRLQFRSLEEVLASGELQDIYSREQLEHIVLNEVIRRYPPPDPELHEVYEMLRELHRLPPHSQEPLPPLRPIFGRS
jgi:hypothetical protein